MKCKLFQFSSIFFIIIILILNVFIKNSKQNHVVHDGSSPISAEFDEENGDQDLDHLFSKIDCKVGEKHNYVMATQSSLLNDNKENIQIKAKIELECLEKTQWLNETNGQLKPGQIFNAKILAIEPKRINLTESSNKNNVNNGQLQMAELFANLQNLEAISSANTNSSNGNENNNGSKNIKLGAVNGFFSEMSNRFGKWLVEIFEKFLHWIQRYSNKKRAQASKVPVNFNLQCIEQNDTTTTNSRNSRMYQRNRRDAQQPPKKMINLDQFASNYSEMFKNPFKFIQLEDGSIQSIQLSKLDTNRDVRQYKKFIARAFATQLDERKKLVLEQSDLGLHYCHYSMDYDEPPPSSSTTKSSNPLSLESSPEQYIIHKYSNRMNFNGNDDPVTAIRQQRKRYRRSSSSWDEESSHMVSVIRQFKKEDIIMKKDKQEENGKINNNNNNNDNIGIRQLDFNVKEVQLIRGNLVVASGGYFQGFLADQPQNNRQRRRNSLKETIFDEFLQKHLDLNLQYSMVKLENNKNNNKPERRRRRSILPSMNDDDENGSTINYGDKIVKLLFSSSSSSSNKNIGSIIGAQKRFKRDTDSNSNSVVCQKVFETTTDYYNDLNTDKDNTIYKEENRNDEIENNRNNKKFTEECYEYKKFGSDILNVYFNRTLRTIPKNQKIDDKSIKNFQTKYNVGARFFNIDLFMGHIDLAKLNNQQAKLTINLFGSEYLDLNLCQIKDKVFSQSNSIPLFVEDIWFITNVALKIKYKLNLKIDIPQLNCDQQNDNFNNNKSSTLLHKDNNLILEKAIENNLEIQQKTNMEFGASVEASFLILNGEMRLNGQFDMDSLLDLSGSCVSAKTNVKPMDIGIDFNYQFFHPVCNQWMQDRWKPKPLSWKLNKEYRNSWFPQTCI